MRVELLPDGRAKILRATADMNCHYDSRAISCGEHAVAIDTPRKRSSMVWFSIGGLDGFIGEIRSFTPKDTDEYEKFGPHSQYRYANTTAGSACIVCNKENELGRRQMIELREPHTATPPWFHYDCSERLCQVLDTTWEYTSTLLSDTL